MRSELGCRHGWRRAGRKGWWGWVLLGVLLGGGCGYQWAGVRQKGSIIEVRPVRDRAGYPQVAAALTWALREALHRMGTGSWRRSVLLRVELVEVRKIPSLYQRHTTGVIGVLGYRLLLVCRANLLDPTTDQPLHPLPITVRVVGEAIRAATILQTESLLLQRLRQLTQQAAETLLVRLFWFSTPLPGSGGLYPPAK